tara:strand:- start:927 stop:1592 length:666 start_codon:yes stop_codon:yes gene_type:complete
LQVANGIKTRSFKKSNKAQKMKIFKINFFLVVIFSFFFSICNAQNKKQQIINLNQKIDSLKNNILSLEYKYNHSLNQHSLLSLKLDSIKNSLLQCESRNYKLMNSFSTITKTNESEVNKLQIKIDSLNITLKNNLHKFIGKLVKFYDPQMEFTHIYTFKLCVEGDFLDEHTFQVYSRSNFSADNIKEGNVYEIIIDHDTDEAGYLINTLIEIKETDKECGW